MSDRDDFLFRLCIVLSAIVVLSAIAVLMVCCSSTASVEIVRSVKC